MSSQFPETCNEFDFVECASCRAKPGMPELCSSCLHNRHAISVLDNKAEEYCALMSLLEESNKRLKWSCQVLALTLAITLFVTFVLARR